MQQGVHLQMWMADEIGQIHSMKDTIKRLTKDRVSLILSECDDSVRTSALSLVTIISITLSFLPRIHSKSQTSLAEQLRC